MEPTFTVAFGETLKLAIKLVTLVPAGTVKAISELVIVPTTKGLVNPKDNISFAELLIIYFEVSLILNLTRHVFPPMFKLNEAFLTFLVSP